MSDQRDPASPPGRLAPRAPLSQTLVEGLKPGDALVSRTGTRWVITAVTQGAFTTLYTLNREGTRRSLVRTDWDLRWRWNLAEAPSR